jgi:hypothetical protein
LVIDEVLPVIDSTEFDEIFDTNTSDLLETKSQEYFVIHHSTHDTGTNHTNESYFIISTEKKSPPDLNIPTPDSPTSIRLDSPTASSPVASIIRLRPLASDDLVLKATQPLRNSGDAPSEEMSQARLRENEKSLHLYAEQDPVGFLGSINNTLLLAWTMVRSSIANFLSQNDSGGTDERRVLSLNSKNEERVEKAKSPHKK